MVQVIHKQPVLCSEVGLQFSLKFFGFELQGLGMKATLIVFVEPEQDMLEKYFMRRSGCSLPLFSITG